MGEGPLPASSRVAHAPECHGESDEHYPDCRGHDRLLGYILLDLLGQAGADHAVEALWRRPSLPERRQRNRGLLKCGVVAALIGAGIALAWLAAATSGHQEDADDARVFGVATAALALIAAGLLAMWWRRSGTARHY